MDGTVGTTPPKALLYTAAPFLLAALILAWLKISTTWNYYRSIKNFQAELQTAQKKIVEPPQIPYTLPFLGNTLGFLSTTPGLYWDQLFQWHPRSSGACSLVLGGKRTHILYTPHVMAAMFKEKTLKRDNFEEELYSKVLPMGEQQKRQAIASKHREHETNAAYMTRPERVNELTADFTRVLDEVLSRDAEEMANKGAIGLYDWLRDRMFTASSKTLFGDYIFEYYPDFCKDFFDFDRDFLSFFFGFPKFTMRESYTRRDRILSKLQEWNAAMLEQSGGAPVDPEGPSWEPYFGSRLNRARQNNYKRSGFTKRTGALLDLGITFGLSSNVIPATGWMLMYILDPKGDSTLLGRVMDELRQTEQPDGSIDIATLISQPLIQSIWTETLRLCADVLVARNATQDIVLPLNEDGKTFIQIRKGDDIFAPSWIGHHDPEAWADDKASVDTFNADRFLKSDPKNPDKKVFTMASQSRFFPFGGGRTICPGRVFAKQEALGALAMVLLRFDIEVVRIVDKDGKPSDEFVKPLPAVPGTAALAPGGDMIVRITPRNRA